MDNSNIKRKEQLGMLFGTACGRLRKSVMFMLAQKCTMDICYRCNTKIIDCKDLTIEHKEPWLDNNLALFFDLNNIAFSHLKCNISIARRNTENLKSWLDKIRPENKKIKNGLVWCSGHKQYLIPELFGNHSGKKFGYQDYCKDCR